MSNPLIQQSLNNLVQFLAEHPEEWLTTDTVATATIENGLRCRATGPNGATLVSDMTKAVGGEASAPSPGWLLRAALANCDATVIAMRAAHVGVTLDTLEVTVDSESDNRGMFEMGVSVPPGPLQMRTQVRIGAKDATLEQLHEIVQWAKKRSPVDDALRRAIPVQFQVEIV